jgi:hypothetical protein
MWKAFISSTSRPFRFPEIPGGIAMHDRMTHKQLISIICLLLMFGCSSDPETIAGNGGGIEVTNGYVYGSIVDEDGNPAADTRVMLIHRDYDPVADGTLPDSLAVETGSDGAYSFSGVDSGDYNIEAIHLTKRTRLFIADISVSPAADTIEVRTDTLLPHGAVTIAPAEDADPINGYYFIPGTTVNVELSDVSSQDGFIMLDSVPRGMMPTIQFSVLDDPDVSAVPLQGNVQIAPGDTSVQTSLPVSWTGLNIGDIGVMGGAAYSGGIFTIAGGGPDIWNVLDGFYYVYQLLDGDGEITARVISLEDTGPWNKAGVMIRETLDAGSRNVTWSMESHLDTALTAPGIALHHRLEPGDTSSAVGSLPDIVPPYWIRLTRTGNVVESYSSPDGVNWELFVSDTIQLQNSVYIGIAVSSHNVERLCTAEFDNVSIMKY